MHNSKLLLLLNTLNRYEIARLQKFVASPFFNEDEAVISLFLYLKKTNFQVENSAAVWAQIHPTRTYNDAQFKRLCSHLLGLCENFLVVSKTNLVKTTQENDYKQHDFSFILLETLHERGLKKHFSSTLSEVRQSLAAQHTQDITFYQNEYMIENVVFEYLNESVRSTKNSNLAAIDSSLTNFFLIQKLKMYATALNYKIVIQLDIPIAEIDVFYRIAQQAPFCNEPAIISWLSVLNLLLFPENTAFYAQTVATITQHDAALDTNNRKDIYTHIINYCVRKINSNQTIFYNELFDLYGILLEKKYLFNGKYLEYWDYKNIVTLGLRLEKLEWVADFIENYKPFLNDEWRENAYTYNLARLYFVQNRYNEVITLLQDVKYQDVYYKMDSRLTLLKTYYLLGEEEALYALAESFRIFLLREKQISNNIRLQFMNFIKFIKKMLQLRPTEKEKRSKLYKVIEATSALADKQWLLKQTDLLIYFQKNTKKF